MARTAALAAALAFPQRGGAEVARTRLVTIPTMTPTTET